MKQKHTDILIVGAGLTGLLLAFALSKKNLGIFLADKNDFISESNFKEDLRTTAISEGSKKIFEHFGLWKKIKKFANPIDKIKVFDRKVSNKIDFANPDKKSFLGYIIKNEILKKILLKEILNKKNILMGNKVNIENITYEDDYILAKSSKKGIKSKLLVAADGKFSLVRKLSKIKLYEKNYKHKAIVINFKHKNNHFNTAYEIFYKSGPLAILPMKAESKKFFQSSLVWSHDKEYIENINQISTQQLIAILEEKIIDITGTIINIVEKKSFNLSAHINSSFIKDRLLFVGDAAHSVHPIAGQGWNLGVRDIYRLCQSLDEAISLGIDCGSEFVCKNYQEKTYKDAYALYQITDKLNSIFLNETSIVKIFRSLGMEYIDKKHRINNFVSKYAMGDIN